MTRGRFDLTKEFEDFFLKVEPPLRHALVARYGPDGGREAAAHALAWAWEHRETALNLEQPVAYLYRVGRSGMGRRKRPLLWSRDTSHEPWIEPGLDRALRTLSVRQRVAVVLVYGYDWTTPEVANLLHVRPTTVQSHLERGLRRLRSQLRAEVP